jgi:hypothetical protein
MAVNGTRSGHTGELLVGRALSVNERCLRLEGRSGWLNFSKWAEAIGAPSVGGLVTVTLDKDGFVRTVAPAESTDGHESPVAGRETAIIRQTCRKGGRRVLRGQARARVSGPRRPRRADRAVGRARSRGRSGRPPRPAARRIVR